MSETSTYKAWKSMKERCKNTNRKEYKHYGERGITICRRWLESFSYFLDDMGERPNGMTLERNNNDKGYEKSNCCWASRKQQSRNTRRNRFLYHNGEKKTISEWAEIYGITANKIAQRLTIGWDLKRAIETP
jgi:hypothetical protein